MTQNLHLRLMEVVNNVIFNNIVCIFSICLGLGSFICIEAAAVSPVSSLIGIEPSGSGVMALTLAVLTPSYRAVKLIARHLFDFMHNLFNAIKHNNSLKDNIFSFRKLKKTNETND